MKLASRDILDVLRQYKIAGNDNVPRNIETVKLSHTTTYNSLASFKFMHQQYYILLDDVASDNKDYVLSQIRKIKTDTKGEIILNPLDTEMTYGLPYRGKDCYLFKVTSDKKRLDVELSSRYPDNSRSTWQKYIKAGYVSVNDKVVTSPKFDVTESDSIAINIPEKPDYSKDELPIVYIDDNVIVINKPCGVLSHSKGVLNEEFTVADFFKRYTTYNIDSNRAGIVHRLDRDTSGIMIGARNEETAVMLQKQFADRKTKKTYFAIVFGRPKLDKANIDVPISRNPSAPSTFKVNVNGKQALTQYSVVANENNLSLVKLQPQTGRTHQLRVHMKYINTPIVGDKVYGKASDRLYLHATSLEITIPNGDRRTFVASLPADFIKYFPGYKTNG